MNPTTAKSAKPKQENGTPGDTPVKFKYIVTPNQVYITRDSLYDSIVTLTIGVTNDTPEDIKCEGIRFTLAIGGGKTDLSNDPSIEASSNEEDWSIGKVEDGVYSAIPIPPNTGIKAKASITFQLSGIKVNTKQGTTTMQIKEHYPGDNSQTSIQVNKILSALNIDSFEGNPVEIDPGDSTTLSWETTAADRVTLDHVPPSELPTTGNIEVQPEQSTTYTLKAFGEGPTVSKQLNIGVKTVQILGFSADHYNVAKNGTSKLSWKTLNAESVYLSTSPITVGLEVQKVSVLDPGDIPVAPEGEQDVTVEKSTVYTLTVVRRNARVTQQLTITVGLPEIKSFTAAPAGPVNAGDEVTLSWETQFASRVSIDSGVGPVNPIDSRKVKPGNTTLYTLTCEGLTTVSQSVTVQVNSVEVESFTVTPPAIYEGQEATLSWEILRAAKATINTIGDVTVPNGSAKVKPIQDTFYTITCQGPNGPASNTIKLAVNPVKITLLEFSYPLLSSTPLLSWRTEGATSAALIFVNGTNNPVVATDPSGSREVRGNERYRLVAQGLDGPVSKEIYINLKPIDW